MKKKLQGKIALITGASGGFGKSLALSLAKEGCDLILIYKRNIDQMRVLEKKLKLLDIKFDIIKADVSKMSQITRILKYIRKKKKIDILINNAGINKVTDFEKINSKDWDNIMNVNLKSAFFLTQEVFKIMKKNKFGRIVNISSGAALYHGPRTAHYAISKAGLISMTKLIARFGAPYNILCNAIAPGIIETNLTKKEIRGSGGKNYIDMTLLKRFGRISDVVSSVLFLISGDQNYMTGDVMNITGGAYLG